MVFDYVIVFVPLCKTFPLYGKFGRPNSAWIVASNNVIYQTSNVQCAFVL